MTPGPEFSVVIPCLDMEFASEMVLRSTLLGLRIAEVPVVLHRDGLSRPSHLRRWRDGCRHLRLMLAILLEPGGKPGRSRPPAGSQAGDRRADLGEGPCPDPGSPCQEFFCGTWSDPAGGEP